jgi:hypothetical protein
MSGKKTTPTPVSFRILPETVERLQCVAKKYGFLYGGNPSISRLLDALEINDIVLDSKKERSDAIFIFDTGDIQSISRNLCEMKLRILSFSKESQEMFFKVAIEKQQVSLQQSFSFKVCLAVKTTSLLEPIPAISDAGIGIEKMMVEKGRFLYLLTGKSWGELLELMQILSENKLIKKVSLASLESFS